MVKVFLYVFDVAADQAPTSVVPGSHRIPWAAGEVYAPSFGGGGGGADADDGGAGRTDLMPNYHSFVAPAGSACIFDLATWHTAQANTSGRERENFILGYHNKRTRSPTGHLPPGATLARLDDAGLLRQEAKEMLGLHDPDWLTGNPFDRLGEIRTGSGQRMFRSSDQQGEEKEEEEEEEDRDSNWRYKTFRTYDRA